MTKNKIIIIFSFIAFTIIVCFIYFSFSYSENNKKLFYIEDEKATYKITKDSNYYWLEGNNSVPNKEKFQVLLHKDSRDVKSFLNKKIYIKGKFVLDGGCNVLLSNANLEEKCNNLFNGGEFVLTYITDIREVK